MAMGVPVVSTPVSGVPEIVEDGVSGLLVEPDEPDMLAAAMARLLDSPHHRQRLASAARAAVTSRFGEGRDSAALDRLLLNAIGAGKGAIGYVVKGFPRLSESFISNEVLKLEALGKDIVLFSASHGDELAAPVLADMTSPLAYLPVAGSVSKNSLFGWLRIMTPAYLPRHLRLLARHPIYYLSAVRQTVHFARRYRHSKDRCAKRAFFKQFAQAGAIAEAAERAGVTHLHGHFCHSATTITWLAARMAGLSFSFTAHAKDIYQARHNPRDLLARKVAAAQFVTTCTAANHVHLAERVDCPSKLHTIYHGLDTRFFASGERASSNSLRILAVGRHVEKKGFDLLIEALAQLAARGIDFDCRIVGEEGPATRQLAQAILDRKLEGRCRLDPPEKRSTLRDSYRAADIFVLPCRIDDSGDRDGIPNVLAEAMATGLAVVSTKVSGIPEIVTDGENGLLVAPDDAKELADAIARLQGDPALCDQLGKAAAERIREIFDADRTILDLKRLFDSALREEPAA
jgi:glycosyltransferase involved in cell wall biosynthesis